MKTMASDRPWQVSRKLKKGKTRFHIPMPRPALILLLLAQMLPTPGSAHEIRPAYISIKEQRPGIYEIFWKLPIASSELSIEPRFPAHCRQQGNASYGRAKAARFVQWRLDCGDVGLQGQRIDIDGLSVTLTEVWGRFEALGQPPLTVTANAGNPFLDFGAAPNAWHAYFPLGMKHILSAPDHLLFLCILALLAQGLSSLVATVTAFTLAHSITLGATTLGFITVPSQPIEILIALSIVYSALLTLRKSSTRTRGGPWKLAFAFGLLHGFGFAGTLASIGLPEENVPLALLFFNLGVEAGQLAFIALLVCLWQAGSWLLKEPPAKLPLFASYCVGGTAAFWTLQRLSVYFF